MAFPEREFLSYLIKMGIIKEIKPNYSESNQKLVNKNEIESLLIPGPISDYRALQISHLMVRMCRLWAASWSLGFGTELLC